MHAFQPTGGFIAWSTRHRSSTRVSLNAQPPATLEFDGDSPSTRPSRRQALQASAATALGGLLLATGIEPAVATGGESITIQASWTAVDGLNSDNQDFVQFDYSAYKAMKEDPTRTPLFKQAILNRLGKDPNGPTSQIVLDMGTGPFALFAILAAELGAGKVYAIEADAAVAASARKVIDKQGWSDIITVLEGFSNDITLPNGVKADFCIAEIVGSIATEEGAYATIRDAHARLVKDPTNPSSWIPQRMQTYAAPASYTLHNLFGPPEFDWDKLKGEPVRFNCRDPGLQLLADPVLVEDVEFCKAGSQDSGSTHKDLSFVVDAQRMNDNRAPLYDEFRRGNSSPQDSERLAEEASHSLSGIAFWPRLILDDTIVVDSRHYGDGTSIAFASFGI
jgi:predicted RNA methylase